MIETNSPGPSSGETDEPKPEQVRQPPQGQGKGTPRPYSVRSQEECRSFAGDSARPQWETAWAK
jgi:hypothetical protein